MKTKLITCILITIIFTACKSDKKKTASPKKSIQIEETTKTVKEEPKTVNYFENASIKITPIEHASMVIDYNETAIYVDPVGDSNRYSHFSKPNFILITDIHGDHLDTETIQSINTPNTIIIGPQAVKDKLPDALKTNYNVIFNGLSRNFTNSKLSLDVEGIPMYNLREEAKKFHPKERGNGYVLTINNKRIYISGDTEDIPEMRNLKHIDLAIVCMNLPYTMPVENAADAVLAFQPKKVMPYHYRGTEGFSDVQHFETLINMGNSDIEVIQLDWYK